MKKRLDVILFERGFFESREKAKREIMVGNVTVCEHLVTKAGTMYKDDENLNIRIKDKLKYVSRGGLKLEGAIKAFDIDFEDKVVLDIGSSTGGFTDCALQHKAIFVYSVDVGTNQLAYSLRNNEKVKSIENTHINKLDVNLLNMGLADIVVADLSFISLTKVIPDIRRYIKKGAYLVLLIKPQFEVGADYIGKNGIVKEEKYREFAINKVKDSLIENNYELINIINSPIKGTKGNIEYLAYIKDVQNYEEFEN
ncbi:TlyA family RNA methyltransferase [Caviibacter abscessus]|uniref:TlyA family RNA methyltransferase n=1 Tax=Caviibacter abscessus TaxID=1766719 RepID=UPI00082FC8FD|nr:TlyA family RNA methyltransferase [Caviibacter abscessus]